MRWGGAFSQDVSYEFARASTSLHAILLATMDIVIVGTLVVGTARSPTHLTDAMSSLLHRDKLPELKEL